MHMPDLHRDLRIAHQLNRCGQRSAAAHLLLTHLRHCDPVTARTHPVLVEAVVLYLSIATASSWPAAPPEPCRASQPAVPSAAAESSHPSTRHCLGVPPTTGITAAAAGPGDPARLVINHRALSVDLEQAQRLHRHGRCGEAIRHAERALHAWQARHPGQVSGRGVALIAGLAAMLSACLRDTAARAVIAANSAYLPMPGTAGRRTFATHALAVMDSTIQPHPPVCLAHSPTAVNTTLDAGGDDRLPWWSYRRDRWWHLLICGPESAS